MTESDLLSLLRRLSQLDESAGSLGEPFASTLAYAAGGELAGGVVYDAVLQFSGAIPVILVPPVDPSIGPYWMPVLPGA